MWLCDDGLALREPRRIIACGLGVAFLLAWAIHPAIAGQVLGKIEPVPGNLGAFQLSHQGLSGTLSQPDMPSQLNALQANPVEELKRLKASVELPDIVLYNVLSHPEAISQQQEALTRLIGPENFQTLATTARELGKLDGAARELLSPGGNPAAALEEFKRNFDGASRQASGWGDSGVVEAPAHFAEGGFSNSGLRKPETPDPSASSADREILSLGEKIAQGITQDEELKLVPWEPAYEGDQPTWRLIKEGGHFRIQYVPEDLRHASQDAVKAHLMQEIFRAVYSRPDLIESDLQSDSLFQMLYDTLETGRVVQKGLKERPGLSENFSAFHQEQYRDPESEEAAQSMKDLPSYLQFLEGALYEGRQGKKDPRIQDENVREVLENTRAIRGKIAVAEPEEANRLIRELWPTIRELYKESEDAAMLQKLLEEMGQEGSGEGQNAAAGQGQGEPGGQNKLEKLSPQEQEELREQVRRQMKQQEQGFRKTLGKSRADSQPDRQCEGLAQKLEEAAERLAQEAGEAQAQARDLEGNASQIRAETGAKEISPQEAESLDAQASQLHQQASQLSQSAQEFRRMAERIKKGSPSSNAAEKTSQQAEELGRMGQELQNKSRQLQDQTEALKEQLGQGQGQETSSLRQKAAGIEQTAKDIGEKAGQIQQEAKEAQALSQALSEQLKGAQGSQGKSSPSSGQSGESAQSSPDELLSQLKSWSQKQSDARNPADQGSNNPSNDDSSGGQGSGDAVGRAREAIEKLKSGGLDAAQRAYLDELMNPVRGMIDTLAAKFRKHLKNAILGRSLTGLFEGDIDEDALPFYKVRGVGIMKEDLLPGRRKVRLTMMIDLSGSMGGLDSPGATLYHAGRALVLGLKALQRAFKNQAGVEVRIVAYNSLANIPILAYTQAKDMTDAVIHHVIKKLDEEKGGGTADIETMNAVVEDIRQDMKKRPETQYAILHMGDGNPQNSEVASGIAAIYGEPANAKIRFGNLAAGPGAEKMFKDYKPHSFWASEIAKLGTAWGEMIEAVFKRAWK